MQKNLDPEKEFKEYKNFAFKGRLVEIAVAFTLGASFQQVVNAVSKNLIMPFVEYFISLTGHSWREYVWQPIDGMKIEIGAFCGAFVDFVLISLILFIVYQKLLKPLIPVPQTTKRCPFCQTDINLACKRCPACTSFVN